MRLAEKDDDRIGTSARSSMQNESSRSRKQQLIVEVPKTPAERYSRL